MVPLSKDHASSCQPRCLHNRNENVTNVQCNLLRRRPRHAHPGGQTSSHTFAPPRSKARPYITISNISSRNIRLKSNFPRRLYSPPARNTQGALSRWRMGLRPRVRCLFVSSEYFRRSRLGTRLGASADAVSCWCWDGEWRFAGCEVCEGCRGEEEGNEGDGGCEEASRRSVGWKHWEDG